MLPTPAWRTILEQPLGWSALSDENGRVFVTLGAGASASMWRVGGGRVRVLLVEDDEDTGDAVALLLQQMGHEVAWVTTAAAARSTAELSTLDVVIADQGLPDSESGVELLAWMEEKQPKARRILTSGVRPKSTSDAGYVFLPKPFGQAELERLLTETSPKP